MAYYSENPALAAMVAHGGDYLITAGTTPTSGLLFSHIVILADAVINDIKVSTVTVSDGVATAATGTSCKTSKHLTGTIPTNYIISAGHENAFSYVKLTSGTAQGVILHV